MGSKGNKGIANSHNTPQHSLAHRVLETLNPKVAKSSLTVLGWHQPELNLLCCEETQQDYQRHNLLTVSLTVEHLLAATQSLDPFERKKDNNSLT